MAIWRRISSYMKTIANETAKKSFLAHEPKTQLEHYLAYYIGRNDPGYAVLVTGEWGTGKTYQVTKALPESHAYYASLFGLSTPQEIEAEVFARMFPDKAMWKKITDKIPAVNVGIPGAVSMPVSSLATSLANTFIKNTVDASKPLILDDLERCAIPPKELLGIINRYVEHHKCRVIVIAHDEKIVGGFQEAKEKIFGQTIKIEPDIEAAFEHFNKTLVESGREDFLGELKSEVLRIFKESNQKSLRILRHVLEDAQRLMGCTEPRHRENNAAMIEMTRLFSALAIECRSGELSAEDLNDRVLASLRREQRQTNGNAEAPESSYNIADRRYKSVKLTSDILNDQVLKSTLIYGNFIARDIRDSLDNSSHFIAAQALPTWRKVLGFDTLDDEIVQPALKDMLERYEKREILESGEFLHFVAFRMMMADEGISQETILQIVDGAKAYIDDLLEQGRMPPREAGRRWIDRFDTGYDNHAYWLRRAYEEQFTEILNCLIDARKKAAKLRYPDLIPSLLETLKVDGEKFFEKVCYTEDGTIEYEDIPILADISAKDFVDTWLASPKGGWYWIGTAVKERRNAAHRESSLEPEIAWSAKVFEEMMRRAENENSLAKLRIIRAAKRIGIKSAHEPAS